MKINKFLIFVLFIQLLCGCTDDDNSFFQYFLENRTNETIYFKAFSRNILKMEFALKPKKRKFLNGYMRNGDVPGPVGIATIRADSIIIELKNGKKWINVCHYSTQNFPSNHCNGNRSLFNFSSYKKVNDEGRFFYYNHIFEFDENDAKNAK